MNIEQPTNLNSIEKFAFSFSQNDKYSTLKGELIPYIVKKQMSRPSAHTEFGEKPTSIDNVNTKSDDIFQFVRQNDLDRKITETSLYNDSVNRNPFNDDIIRCYALSAPEKSFGLRVNTTLSYCAANQKIFTLWEKLFADGKSPAPPLISPQSNIKSTQMTSCAVADHTVITEKTSLKNCIVGTNCTVNVKTRISNSVLMSGVTIEEGYVHSISLVSGDPMLTFLLFLIRSCVIENCVICDRAIVRSNCVLKNCLVGPNYEVSADTNKEKAHLTNVTMEIE